VTLWQSVTALTLGKNEFRKYRAVLETRQAALKMVWRIQIRSIVRRFSIVKTLALEQPDEMRVFYRAPRERGALALSMHSG
jgi:hypothetical protein